MSIGEVALEIYTVMRVCNIVLSLFSGVHLVITFRSIFWAQNRWYVRCLRMGTGVAILSAVPGSIYNIHLGRPATWITAWLWAALVITTIGVIGSIVDNRAVRRAAAIVGDD